jgi:hypothetical protein
MFRRFTVFVMWLIIAASMIGGFTAFIEHQIMGIPYWQIK